MRPVFPLFALALLASMVTGREQAVAPDTSPPAPARTPQPLATNVVHDLDLGKLVRHRQERSYSDLFATSSPAPYVAPTAPPFPEPAPASAPVPAASPSAPPLPFAYLGRLVTGERTVAYVLKGEQMYLAEAGQMLGEDYRVEGITDTALRFVYIPLGTKQVLSFPARD